MPSLWNRLFAKQERPKAALTLLDYAENYLVVFEVGSQDEKTRIAEQLFEAANSTAHEVGAGDLHLLIQSANIEKVSRAAVYSRQRFDELFANSDTRFGAGALALTHFMILNSMAALNDTPRAELVARKAAHLYSATYAGNK
jgi:hypothetical protein